MRWKDDNFHAKINFKKTFAKRQTFCSGLWTLSDVKGAVHKVGYVLAVTLLFFSSLGNSCILCCSRVGKKSMSFFAVHKQNGSHQAESKIWNVDVFPEMKEIYDCATVFRMWCTHSTITIAPLLIPLSNSLLTPNTFIDNKRVDKCVAYSGNVAQMCSQRPKLARVLCSAQGSFCEWAQPTRDDVTCKVVPHWLGNYTKYPLECIACGALLWRLMGIK